VTWSGSGAGTKSGWTSIRTAQGRLILVVAEDQSAHARPAPEAVSSSEEEEDESSSEEGSETSEAR